MRKFLKQIKDSGVLSVYRKLKDEIQDRKQNRQLIGKDRFGNKYYQYYSFFGLPTRREIRFKNQLDFAMKDLVYYQWLHHRTFDPPTQVQKQQFYLQQKIRYQKAIQWDRKDEMTMLQFRRKRQQLLLRNQALKQIEQDSKNKQQQVNKIQTKRQEQAKK